MSGQCKKCHNYKAGVREAESKLLGRLRAAESKPSMSKTVPAAQEKLRVQKALLQRHEHEEHGAAEAPAVFLQDESPDHGTYQCYVRNKCRCDECKEANAARSREYYRTGTTSGVAS